MFLFGAPRRPTWAPLQSHEHMTLTDCDCHRHGAFWPNHPFEEMFYTDAAQNALSWPRTRPQWRSWRQGGRIYPNLTPPARHRPPAYVSPASGRNVARGTGQRSIAAAANGEAVHAVGDAPGAPAWPGLLPQDQRSCRAGTPFFMYRQNSRFPSTFSLFYVPLKFNIKIQYHFGCGAAEPNNIRD